MGWGGVGRGGEGSYQGIPGEPAEVDLRSGYYYTYHYNVLVTSQCMGWSEVPDQRSVQNGI